jgi:extracellular matrix protein 14
MKDLARAIFESHPLYPQHEANITNCSTNGFTPLIRSRPDETNVFFGDYQPLSAVIPWMKLMGSLFSSHVQVIKVGTSYEGRDIPAFRLGVPPTNSEKPSNRRKSIIISGGIHAREWISTATVNYVAFSLMSSYGKSKDVTKLLEQFDWIFIPTLNPDGYVYTWEQDRLWRKNRQNTTLSLCKGLDLDRTYPYQWDGNSTLSNPCSESFAGEGPLDAVESVQFASWIKETEKNGTDVVGFLDLHSYSQQILYPYAYSCIDTPPSMENLEELALGLEKAIHGVNGEVYGVTSACEGYSSTRDKGKAKSTWTRFESGGGSVLDWMYHEMRVKYAYQLKLRDTGSYGFLLPAKNIIPTGREIFAAATYFGKFLMSDKGIESIDEPELEDSNFLNPGMTYISNSEAAERHGASSDAKFEQL